MHLSLRHYRSGDEAEIWDLFYQTIHRVNIQDYSQEQVNAWAPAPCDAERWRRRIEHIAPWVCLSDGKIVGYADLQDSGLIDHFFVHYQWQRRGVGKQLFSAIEQQARRQRIRTLTSHVSITARPFFESRGFRVVEARQVAIGQVLLPNFKMTRHLPDATQHPHSS